MAAHDRFLAFENLGNGSSFVEPILGLVDTIPVLEGFGRKDIEVLARYLHCYRLPSAVEVIAEGELGDFMVLVIEGRLDIAKLDSENLPICVGEAGPGKTLGEMSVIDGEPRFASCVTLAPTTIAVLEREELGRFGREHPELALKLVTQISVQLNQRLRQVSYEYIHCKEKIRQLMD